MATNSSRIGPKFPPAESAAKPGSTIVGDIRKHPRVRSEYLTRTRDVLVYLPPGYDSDRRRRYPVLYMQDGQNLFDGATSLTTRLTSSPVERSEKKL